MKGLSATKLLVRVGSPTTPIESVQDQLSSREYSVQSTSPSVQLYQGPAAALAVLLS
jgi:hypothetical protein